MELKALHKITYGLYVVTSAKEGKLNGQIANTVFQITSEPPTMAVSINKQNLTHGFIYSSRVFAVSILSRDTPVRLIGNFGFKSGKDIDKFAQVHYKVGKTGAPIVMDNTLGYLEAQVINEINAGTHTVFIGKLVEAEIFRDGEPMTYAYYHEVKRGLTPESAPTYIKKEEKVSRLAKYRCTVCGYIYDSEQGDPDGGIKPGTAFEEIPDDWVCPICGAAKSDFEKIEE